MLTPIYYTCGWYVMLGFIELDLWFLASLMYVFFFFHAIYILCAYIKDSVAAVYSIL